MEAWQIALIVIAAIILFLITLVSSVYYILLPNFLVKKLRNGKEVVTNPPDFDAIQAKVCVEKDCKYPSKYSNNTYDIYQNTNKTSKGTIVWVHGGFFIAGDKNGVSNVATCLAAEGYTIIAINYALAPSNKYPTQLLQLDEVIKHIVTERNDINTTNIILAGDSAGGQIVSQYITMVNNPALQTELHISPFATKELICAMILVSAPIDVSKIYGVNKKLDMLLPIFGRAFYGKGKWFNSKKFKSTRTFDYLTGAMPPTFLTDGNNISFETQNRTLGKVLRDKGTIVNELYFDKAEYGEVNHEYLFCLDNNTALLGLKSLITFLNNTTNTK